jgi:hypothetical protein
MEDAISKGLQGQADTPPTQSGCTSGCTTNVETPNVGTVEALAAALLMLPPANHARLAAVLLTPPTGPFEGEAADAPQAPQPKGEG